MQITNFYFKVFGLFSCLFGISLFSSIENLIVYFKKLIDITENQLKVIYSLKNIFFLILIFSVIINIGDLFTSDYAKMIELKPEIINATDYYTSYKIYFCFFVSKMYKYSIYSNDEKYDKFEQNYSLELFYNHTVSHMFENMKSFEDVFESGKTTEGQNVTFIKGKACFHKDSFCFEIFIDFALTNREPYIFEFNKNVNKVYLLKDMNSLTLRTRRYFDDQKNDLRELNQVGSQKNCEDYSKNRTNCFSRQSCVDLCILETYVQNYNKLPLLILFEDEIKRWGNLNFTNERNKTISSDCYKKYAKLDCYHTVYDRDTKSLPTDQHPNQKRWNISLFESEKKETDIYENGINEFISDIFTIYAIFLGINIPKLSSLVVRELFNLRSKKLKYFGFFYFFLGFVSGSFLILEDINGIKKFDYYTDGFHIIGNSSNSNINICVDLNLDMNKIRTGRDLEIMTKNITIETFIEEIRYINMSLGFENWRPINGADELAENLNIRTIFYEKYKCIQLLYKLDTTNLRFRFVNYILEISLNKKVFDKFDLFVNSDYTFFKLTKDTIDSNSTYQVNLNRFERIKKNFLRNFEKRSTFYILDKFKEYYNRTTLLLPLTESYFDLKIDDSLFTDFYGMSESETILDYKIEYQTKLNLLATTNRSIYISKNVYKKISYIENIKNLPSLIIELFNCCSLWLTLSFFDLIYLFFILIEKIIVRVLNKNATKTRIIFVNEALYDQLCKERIDKIMSDNDFYF